MFPTEYSKKDLGITKCNLLLLSDVCLALGFASIVGSLFVWFTRHGKGPEQSLAERRGIFVGLWVPSFFILSNRLARKAEEIED